MDRKRKGAYLGAADIDASGRIAFTFVGDADGEISDVRMRAVDVG